MSDSEFYQPEGPNLDLFGLAIIVIFTIFLVFVAIEKLFAEPNPCTIKNNIVNKKEFAIFQSPTEAKIFSDEHNGKIYSSQDGNTISVEYIQTWAESDGDSCWKE